MRIMEASVQFFSPVVLGSQHLFQLSGTLQVDVQIGPSVYGVALLNKSVSGFLRSVYHGLPYHPDSRSEHGLQRLSGLGFFRFP